MQIKKTAARNAHINVYKKDRASITVNTFFAAVLLAVIGLASVTFGIPYVAKATGSCSFHVMGKTIYKNHECDTGSTQKKMKDIDTSWEDKANEAINKNKKEEKRVNRYKDNLENSRSSK